MEHIEGELPRNSIYCPVHSSEKSIPWPQAQSNKKSVLKKTPSGNTESPKIPQVFIVETNQRLEVLEGATENSTRSCSGSTCEEELKKEPSKLALLLKC